MVAGTVGEDSRIENFTAGTALPCIEGANEVVILFGVHSSFALGTFHDLFLLLCDQMSDWLRQVGIYSITPVMPALHRKAEPKGKPKD
jgi:hypothetical protein